MRLLATLPTTSLPAAFLALLLLLAPQESLAQIEVGAGGNVGVRNGSTGSSGLYVTCWGDCFTQGNYTYGWGVYARSLGKSRNRALYGRASTGADNPSSVVKNYGLYGIAEGGGNQNFGLYARAEGASTVGYGIYATAIGAGASYAGYFSGDVHVTGALTEASDAMFKRDVEPLGGGEGENALTRQAGTRQSSPGGDDPPPRSQTREQLLELRPVKYHYRRGQYEEMGFPEGEHFGFLAQEVEAVLPELVTESVHPGTEEIGPDGEPVQTGEPLSYKSVNYLGLVPMLVQTAKEQQAEIDALRAELEALQELVEGGDQD